MSEQKKIPDEQRLRERLEHYEPAFDRDAWTQLQQQLAARAPGFTASDAQSAPHTGRPDSFYRTFVFFYLLALGTISLTGILTAARLPAIMREPAPASPLQAGKAGETPRTENKAVWQPASQNQPAIVKTPAIVRSDPKPFAAANTPRPMRSPADVFIAEKNEPASAMSSNATEPMETADIPSSTFKRPADLAVLANYPLPALTPQTEPQACSPAFWAPNAPSGRYRNFVSGSVLQGITGGQALRAEYAYFVTRGLGFGVAASARQYGYRDVPDATASQTNAPQASEHYNIRTLAVDATLNYRFSPFRRWSVRTWAGGGLRYHDGKIIEDDYPAHFHGSFDPTSLDQEKLTARSLEEKTAGKFGFSAGADVAYDLTKRVSIGAQYLFGKDQLHDIPARHFAGLQFGVRF